MVKVTGPAARDLMAKMRRRVEGVPDYKPLETPLAVSDRDKSVASLIKDEGVVRKLQRAGVLPVAATLKEHEEGDYDINDLGTILMRKPSVEELMQGFDPEFLILTPATATRSPFGYRPPVDATVFGLRDPRSRVTVAPDSTSDRAILYGDINDVINRLVSGSSVLASKVKNAVDLDKLSPQAKAFLGIAAAGGTLYAANKLISPFTYMRLGSRLTDDGNQVAQVDINQQPVESGRISQMLQSNSSMVNPTSDSAYLSGTVYPVPNAFWASAYALGEQFAKRKSQPNFGALVGDVGSPLRQLRSLRCPKFYISPEGTLFRTSAPYCVSWLTDAALAEAKAVRERQPLQGGILSSLATGALSAIKSIGGKVLSKLKEWGQALWDKIKKGFKKLFGKKTHHPAKSYTIYASPIRMAAFIWSKLGKLPNSVVDMMDAMMNDHITQLTEAKESEDAGQQHARDLAQKLFDYAERERTKAGVPSDTAWNAPPMWIGSADGTVTGGPQFDVLRQYAEKAAENIRQLASCPSNDLIDIFDTRNPVLLFSDTNGLESDIRDLLAETDAELARRDETSGAAKADGSAAPSEASAQPAVSQVVSTGTAPAAPIISEDSNKTTDPEAFARAIAINSGVSKPGRNIPQEWISELPVAAQEAYYGVASDETSDPAFVGDILSSKHRLMRSHNAAVLRSAIGSRYQLGRMHRIIPSEGPMTGFAPIVAAAIPVVKTLATWIIPSLLMMIDWKNVSTWVKKNGAKAKVLLSGGFSRQRLSVLAAKSGGALGAFAKALKTLGSKAALAGKLVLGFAWRNPKAAVILSLVAAAWALGSSKTTDGKAYKALMDLLLRALREVDQIFHNEDAAVKAHIDAITALSTKTGGQYSEADAEELQTCAMLCVLVASALKEGTLTTDQDHSALDELLEAYNKAKDSVIAESQQEDWDAMMQVMEAQLTETGGEELAKQRDASTVNVASEIAAEPGLSPDTASALTKSLAALGVAGTVMGGVGSTSPKNGASDAAPAAGPEVGTPAASASSPGPGGDFGPEQALGAGTAPSGEELVGSLSDSQLDELRTTAQALSLAGASGSESEASVSAAGRDLAAKWGLGALSAAALVALLAALVKARRRGSSGTGGSSGISDAVSWWQGLWQRSSSAEGATTPAASHVSGVVL